MILEQGRELEKYIDTLIDPNSINYNSQNEIIYISDISIDSANNIGLLVKQLAEVAPACIDKFACDQARNRSAIKLSIPTTTKQNTMSFKQYDIVVAENADKPEAERVTLNVSYRTIEYTLH